MDPHHGDVSIDHHHHHNNPTVFLVVDESKSAQYWANLNFPHLPVKYFSVLQILLGCIAVVCQVIIILIYCQRDSINQEYTTGEGIYSGLFYILEKTNAHSGVRVHWATICRRGFDVLVAGSSEVLHGEFP